MKFYALIPYVLQAIAWPITHFTFKSKGSFTVHGIEHMQNTKGPVILASNHRNEIDPVIQRAIRPMLSKPLFWVARTKSFYKDTGARFKKGWRDYLYGDWFFKAWGAYPAYKGKHDYAHSLQHHVAIINDGFSVGFFPQGTRGIGMSEEEIKQQPAHGGVVYLAQKTGAPIIPVVIKGTRGLNSKDLFKKGVAIEVHILPPLEFSTEKELDYKQEAEDIMKKIYAYV